MFLDFSDVGFFVQLIRRARRPGSTSGRMPDATVSAFRFHSFVGILRMTTTLDEKRRAVILKLFNRATLWRSTTRQRLSAIPADETGGNTTLLSRKDSAAELHSAVGTLMCQTAAKFATAGLPQFCRVQLGSTFFGYE